MMRDFAVDPVPVLVSLDLQREYVTPGRPYCLEYIDQSLENCRRLLNHAREQKWPVAHVRYIQDGHLFNARLPYSRFIEGFEPMAYEMVFTRDKFSCFASPEFSNFMETARHSPVFIMGFNTQMCCLSTLVDALHRGMRLKYIVDASLARATMQGDERQTHDWLLEVLSIYADLVTTDAVLEKETLRVLRPAGSKPSLRSITGTG